MYYCTLKTYLEENSIIITSVNAWSCPLYTQAPSNLNNNNQINRLLIYLLFIYHVYLKTEYTEVVVYVKNTRVKQI